MKVSVVYVNLSNLYELKVGPFELLHQDLGLGILSRIFRCLCTICCEVASHDTGRLNSKEEQNLEIPSFEFRRITSATSNFSNDMKIGEGGFGPVYKVSTYCTTKCLVILERTLPPHIYIFFSKRLYLKSDSAYFC